MVGYDWVGKEVYYPKRIIENWEVKGEFSDFLFTVTKQRDQRKDTEIVADKSGREVKDHSRYFIVRHPTLNPPEHKIHALCRYMGYMCHLKLLDRKEVVEHYCEARDFELFAQGKGKIVALLKGTRGIDNEEGKSAYDLLKDFFIGRIRHDDVVSELDEMAKTPAERELLGVDVFYFKQAIRDWHNFMGYEHFVYTIDEVKEQPENNRTKIAGTSPVNGRTVRDELRFFTRYEKKHSQDAIARLCRYLGWRAKQEVFQLHEVCEWADKTNISLFPKGEGKLAARLHELDLYGEALSYSIGEIEIKELKPKRLIPDSEDMERKGAATITQLRERIAAIGKKGKASEGKVSIDLPKLESAADIAEFVNAVLKDISEKVIGQEAALRRIILRITRYVKSEENNKPTLVTGPTGCGKTYSLRLITERMGLPFTRVVLPDVVPHGYVGPSLQDLMYAELNAVKEKYDGHPERLVMQIDEFDKIVQKGHEFTSQLQNEFLKLLEQDAALSVADRGGKEGAKSIKLDSLLLLSGAFSFIKYDPECEITPDMLRNAGFIEEIIGRIDSTLMLRKLGKEDYLAMLRKPAPLLGEQLEGIRQMGIEVELCDDCMDRLAEIAAQSGLGARSLESVLGATFERVQEKAFYDEPKGKIDGLELSKSKGGKLWKVKIRSQFIPKPEQKKKALMGFGRE